ncbi:MAG: metallophosphoesterase family protein [Desulfopila sp.]
MTTIGILSDTHRTRCDEDFRRHCARVFSDCTIIAHAGDLTDISVLTAFSGKDVYAVHGNMCSHLTRKSLPEQQTFVVDGYTIGLCHGAGNRHNIEERMAALFPSVDCIIYGHTHAPACHIRGTTLFINPGSFQGTGRYGAPGTYALLTTGNSGLHGSLHELPQP